LADEVRYVHDGWRVVQERDGNIVPHQRMTTTNFLGGEQFFSKDFWPAWAGLCEKRAATENRGAAGCVFCGCRLRRGSR
jgi:hypothetical protein